MELNRDEDGNILLQTNGSEKYIADKEQANVLEHREHCKKIGENVMFIITGKAGTGKTSLLNTLVHGEMTMSLAPSNPAVGVMRKKDLKGNNKSIYMTVQKFCKWVPDNERPLKQFDDKYFKPGGIDFELIRINNIKNIVVDECSMMGEEFRGFVDGLASIKDVDIFFVGDPRQLPPVRDTPMFRNTIAQYPNNVKELTVLHRAGPEGIKNIIEAADPFNCTFEMGEDYGEGVEYAEDMPIEEMVENKGSYQMVVYSNKRAFELERRLIDAGYEMNEIKLHSPVTIYDQGTNTNIEVFHNGDIAKIDKINSTEITEHMPWIDEHLTFDSFQLVNEREYDTRFNILNVHDSVRNNANSTCRNRFVSQYGMKHKQTPLVKGVMTPHFEMIKKLSKSHDEFFNKGGTYPQWFESFTPEERLMWKRTGIENKIGYSKHTKYSGISLTGGNPAEFHKPYRGILWGRGLHGRSYVCFSTVKVSTIHKAQGNEWDTVYVDLRGIKGKDAKELLYVAVSRARKRLVIVTGKTHHM